MQDISKIQWPGWETTRLIGRGSFGAVYEIKRTVLGGEEEFAAMKVISIPQSDSDIEELVGEGYDNKTISTVFKVHLTSIVSEYSTMKKMSGCHNIVACDDIKYFQHEDGIGWDILIKMELLTPLMKSLPQSVDENVVINVGIDICSALEICEENDIVHRDIKPQNIFLSKYGDYKLGDFGIAKTVEKTTGGTKIGTYDYMAPEVYNNKPYGGSADIYSLGLVLYWLLNNRRLPFLPQPPEMATPKMKEAARLQRFHGEEIPEPVNGSAELKNIILKACAFDEKNRYTDAAEMKQALVKLTVPEPEPEPEPLPPPPPPPTPGPNVKIIVIIASMAILAFAAIVGIVFANNKPGTVVNQTTDGISVSNETELITQEDKAEESTTEETTEEESTEETTTEETTDEEETTKKKDEVKYKKINETVYATENVNIRKEANTSSAKIGILKKGSSIKRIAIGDNGWSKVTYRGKTAYISSEYLSSKKPADNKPTTTKPTTTRESSFINRDVTLNRALQYDMNQYFSYYTLQELEHFTNPSEFNNLYLISFAIGYLAIKNNGSYSDAGDIVEISELPIELGQNELYGDYIYRIKCEDIIDVINSYFDISVDDSLFDNLDNNSHYLTDKSYFYVDEWIVEDVICSGYAVVSKVTCIGENLYCVYLDIYKAPFDNFDYSLSSEEAAADTMLEHQMSCKAVIKTNQINASWTYRLKEYYDCI